MTDREPHVGRSPSPSLPLMSITWPVIGRAVSFGGLGFLASAIGIGVALSYIGFTGRGDPETGEALAILALILGIGSVASFVGESLAALVVADLPLVAAIPIGLVSTSFALFARGVVKIGCDYLGVSYPSASQLSIPAISCFLMAVVLSVLAQVVFVLISKKARRRVLLLFAILLTVAPLALIQSTWHTVVESDEGVPIGEVHLVVTPISTQDCCFGPLPGPAFVSLAVFKSGFDGCPIGRLAAVSLSGDQFFSDLHLGWCDNNTCLSGEVDAGRARGVAWHASAGGSPIGRFHADRVLAWPY